MSESHIYLDSKSNQYVKLDYDNMDISKRGNDKSISIEFDNERLQYVIGNGTVTLWFMTVNTKSITMSLIRSNEITSKDIMISKELKNNFIMDIDKDKMTEYKEYLFKSVTDIMDSIEDFVNISN